MSELQTKLVAHWIGLLLSSMDRGLLCYKASESAVLPCLARILFEEAEELFDLAERYRWLVRTQIEWP